MTPGRGPIGVKRPSVIGHYTNDFVYTRLVPGVLQELRVLDAYSTFMREVAY